MKRMLINATQAEERRLAIVDIAGGQADVGSDPVGMGIPLLKLLCQLAVLLSIRWKTGRSYGLLLYRIYHHLKDWGRLLNY